MDLSGKNTLFAALPPFAPPGGEGGVNLRFTIYDLRGPVVKGGRFRDAGFCLLREG